MREQRKLAAVLAADVVGYSRLMGRDEAGTLARLKDHRAKRLEPALSRYGGRLVKLTGDGVLAEFPSAVDALKAAIEFQQAVERANADQGDDQRIAFRVGLHLGDMIVDGDDLYGDGLNVAARLEREAPPGGIIVSGALHDAAAGRLQAEFVDLGQLSLKNIDRPVHAYRIEWNQSQQHLPDRDRSTGAVASLPLPDKPSIAVLAFQNMSGDPEQQYFVDGLVDDIITALSRFKALFVIARNSSFAYKGKAVDIKQVGRDLGVRYVLEGSVRKAGTRIRITGQLVEAEVGRHLWADRYEGDLTDVFELQDRITANVVMAIEPQVRNAEIIKAQRKSTTNLTAYDLYLRALGVSYARDEKGLENALKYLEQAIALDRQFSSAYGLSGWLCWHAAWNYWMSHHDAQARGMEAATRAIEFGGEDAEALARGGFILGAMGHRPEEGLIHAQRALSLNPNSQIALRMIAHLHRMLGQHSKTLECIERLMRLNPKDPEVHSTYILIGAAHFYEHRYEEALAWAKKALILRPKNIYAAQVRVSAGAMLGEPREYLIDAFQSSLPGGPPIPTQKAVLANLDVTRQVDRDLVVEVMRKLGIPE